jgi:hypothetical protein
MIPAHLGALESGLVGAFVALGLDAGAGLSFILVRRVRELVWIAIGFIVLACRSVGPRRSDTWLSERA